MRGTASSRLSWLDEVVIPAISAVMYAVWLAPPLRLLLGSVVIHPRNVVYPWWAIVAVLLGAAWLARLLADRRGGRWFVAVAGLSVVLGAVVAPHGSLAPSAVARALAALVDFSRGIPAGLIVLLTTLGLWFGGARARWNQHRQLMHGFVVGILVLALLSLLSPGAVGGEDLVVFLLTGLLALALLSVSSHLSYQVARGLPRPALSRYWLLALGLGMLGILLAGWVLSLVFAPEALASLLARLRPLLGYLGQVIAFVGMFVVWLLYLGYQFIGSLFRRGPSQPPAPEEAALPPSYTEQFPELELTPGTPPSLPEGLGVVLIALVLAALVVYVVLKAWRRRSRPRYTSTALEEREFVWSKDLFLERWRGILDGLGRSRRRELFVEALNLTDPRHRIRQAYRVFLLNARERGLRRLRGQTVTAYRQAVSQAIPSVEEPAASLSGAYLEARYGEASPPESLAQEAQQASQDAARALTEPRRVRRSR
jgi:hypothetical protein